MDCDEMDWRTLMIAVILAEFNSYNQLTCISSVLRLLRIYVTMRGT